MSAKQGQVGQVKSRIPSRGVKPDFPATDFEIRQTSWLAEIDRIKVDQDRKWGTDRLCTLVDNPTPANAILPVAKPADPNLKNYPVLNEIVLISNLPNTDIGQFASSAIPYYTNIVALWNHPHHNAFPQNDNILPPSQQKDYIQTQLGSVRTVTNQSTEVFLGNTFVEKENIHPLLPFEGDVILEGRWGNSIRFGSTVTGSVNTWSSTGQNGDPITILRNGQGIQSNEGWIPTVEDVNNDESSIYLTSTQKIPLEASSTSYSSYSSNPPTKPKSKPFLCTWLNIMFFHIIYLSHCCMS